jgi:hypothetical protein
MAGWGGSRTAPRGTAVLARAGAGPNPPCIILKRSMKALHGSMDTSKEVRMFSTDALGCRSDDSAKAAKSS